MWEGCRRDGYEKNYGGNGKEEAYYVKIRSKVESVKLKKLVVKGIIVKDKKLW